MAVKKHRQIAAGEGRLALGDGVQGDARIGDDPLAIGSRDLVVALFAAALAWMGMRAVFAVFM